MKLPKFLIGIVVGGALAAIFWSWQKSTSAEDGALDLLDRYGVSEARVRDLEAQLRQVVGAEAAEVDSLEEPAAAESPASAAYAQEVDDLQQIAGIGPVYAQRLNDAGVTTFAALALQSPQRVLEITGARSEAAASAWIDAAQQLAAT